MTLSASYWAADRSQPVLDLTVGDALRNAAAAAPRTTALVEGAVDPAARRRWSYAGLLEASERAARALLGRFAPGDRVAVWAHNIPEWVILELAAGLTGITVVTVNPALRPQELAYVLGQSQADGIFLVPAYRASPMAEMVQQVRGDLPALREVVSFADWEAFCAEAAPGRALPEVTPGAPAQIQYTSGTTGFPKGAVLHHRGIVNNARLYTARLGLAPGRRLPQRHADVPHRRLRDVRARRDHHPCDAGAPALLRPRPDVELIAAERPETVLGVPTMLVGMLEHPGFVTTDLSSVRRSVTAGAAVPAALVSRCSSRSSARRSPSCSGRPRLAGDRPDHAPHDTAGDKAGTIGRPLPQTEVKIVDPDIGQTVATGDIGRALHPRLSRHARLFQDAGGDRCRDRRRRLAAHRRPGRDGRARLLPRRGPAQGHDHPRRREHLSPRDRGGAVAHPKVGRGRGGRGARRQMGRGGRRLHPPRARRRRSTGTSCPTTCAPRSRLTRRRGTGSWSRSFR